MPLPIQTALVEWLPSPNEQATFFSVYRSEAAIELHSGCENVRNLRLISTCKDYNEAYELCELLAEAFQLPIQTFSCDRDYIYE